MTSALYVSNNMPIRLGPSLAGLITPPAQKLSAVARIPRYPSLVFDLLWTFF